MCRAGLQFQNWRRTKTHLLTLEGGSERGDVRCISDLDDLGTLGCEACSLVGRLTSDDGDGEGLVGEEAVDDVLPEEAGAADD